MKTKLPNSLLTWAIILAGFIIFETEEVKAVSVAEQTQGYDSGLNVWQVIQELGTNLSGTAQSFTFRVSTSASNSNQFDFTAQNSRIYDKTLNTNTLACIPAGANPNDRLRGLTFSFSSAPAGYEDVTIDFSCRNYDFIPGHKYLILVTNANMAQFGGMRMRLASAAYSGTGNDYFSQGGLRYAYDAGSCNAAQYSWNSQTSNSGCNIFSTPRDDLYFVLTNTALPPPPPRLPVVFIPGIGGSEMKTSQDIYWSKEDGHGGTYSHGYASGEKIWVNQNEAAALGSDDYFDILRLKADGQTPEADLALTGDLTASGYSEIDSFFTDMGYSKGTNFFVFAYDWRKDIRAAQDSLDTLIEQAKQKSGQSKVNLVVHSMGGLSARFYISDPGKAAKVNKLIELGVPHLGAVESLKTLMYGIPLGKPIFKIFNIGIAASESKDIFQNLSSGFQLLPSKSFFSFYDNSNDELLYPFRDDRDIDHNQITGSLDFDRIKNLLSNLNYNMPVFNLAAGFHDLLDPQLNKTNNAKVYEIVGTSQPTLGQIHETWWVTWPINLIPKQDEIFINGDGTVPLYSASLKNDSQNLSGADKIYYVEQEHGNLTRANGTAMQTVKAILNDDNALPVEVKDQKVDLEGEQVSFDDGELDFYDDQNRHCGLNSNGEIEENIPEVTCTTSGSTKHAFVKKKAAKVKVKATRKNPAVNSKTTSLKKRTYKQDKITKTTIYKDLALSQTAKIEFTLDPASDTSPALTFYPEADKTDNTSISATSEQSGSAAFDQTAPVTSIQISGDKNSSGIYTGPVTITLTASDTAGILRIEYSLDNGQTVQVYTDPFTISASGKTTLQVKAIDKSGNEEIPQEIIIEIAAASSEVANTPGVSQVASEHTPGVDTERSSANSSSATSDSYSVIPSFSTVIPAKAGIYTNNYLYGSQIPFDRLRAGESGMTRNGRSSGVLGISFENPRHIADQLNLSNIFDAQKVYPGSTSPDSIGIGTDSPAQILGGLLIVTGGLAALATLGLIITFNPTHTIFQLRNNISFSKRSASPVKPFPK